MKAAALLLALATPAAAQIVGGPVGSGRGMLQFGQPVAGGFLTSVTPVHQSTAAWCAVSLALAPLPWPVPGVAGVAYLEPLALVSLEPAQLGGSGVEWIYRREIPAGVATLGVTVCTQFVTLEPTGLLLSQGWTTPLQ